MDLWLLVTEWTVTIGYQEGMGWIWQIDYGVSGGFWDLSRHARQNFDREERGFFWPAWLAYGDRRRHVVFHGTFAPVRGNKVPVTARGIGMYWWNGRRRRFWNGFPKDRSFYQEKNIGSGNGLIVRKRDSCWRGVRIAQGLPVFMRKGKSFVLEDWTVSWTSKPGWWSLLLGITICVCGGWAGSPAGVWVYLGRKLQPGFARRKRLGNPLWFQEIMADTLDSYRWDEKAGEGDLLLWGNPARKRWIRSLLFSRSLDIPGKQRRRP